MATLQIRFSHRFSGLGFGTIGVSVISLLPSRSAGPLMVNLDLMILLGVNIDHCATLRQARYRQAGATVGGNIEPDPVGLAPRGETAGAQRITGHLREARRHIQEQDVLRLAESKTTRLNLEMAC